MKWMLWHHAGTLHWKVLSCLPRPSLLCCPPSLLFIRRLPMLQHGGVQLPSLSNSLESSSLWRSPSEPPSSIQTSFERQNAIVRHRAFKRMFSHMLHAQNHKYESLFWLPWSFSTLLFTASSQSLCSAHIYRHTHTQPHLKPHPINLRRCSSSFLLPLLSIHPPRFECSGKRFSPALQYVGTTQTWIHTFTISTHLIIVWMIRRSLLINSWLIVLSLFKQNFCSQNYRLLLNLLPLKFRDLAVPFCSNSPQHLSHFPVTY